MGRNVFVLVSFFVCHQLFITTNAQMNFTFGRIICIDKDFNYTTGSVFESNLNILMNYLTTNASATSLYRYDGVGRGPSSAYGLYQCRFDLTLDDCGRCVKLCTADLVERCPLYGEAIVWYEECFARYASNDFYDGEKKSAVFRRSLGGNVSNNVEFRSLLQNTFEILSVEAHISLPHLAYNRTDSTIVDRLYSYVQCIYRETVCYKCLAAALSDLMDCCSDREGGMISMVNCHMRFDTRSPFLISSDLPPTEIYLDSPPTGPTPPSQAPEPSSPQINDQPPADQMLPKSTSTKQGPKTVIIAAIGAGVGAVLLVIVGCLIFLCRNKHKETASNNIPQSSQRGLQDSTENIGDRDFVQYDLATLKAATRDFSDGNKLGQGGFGTVYKGTLENGDHLAIKRLSRSSGQGSNEFKTEALLLAKLQHKNLVKLMGFCSEGDEKLLVYEFMSSGSLDGFLFDPRRQSLLDWAIRHKIILGIARGLQYLHEDSRLTIIHRDLKPGNILLDNDMNPKVADFGLAKLVEIAQRFGNTSRIAGTVGYMAPEYMISGEYSEKSDVYSFGIMLLEIVSGKNNLKFFQTQKEDLPVHAWRLWNEDRTFELTDPAIMDNCLSNDVIRCFHIGLLCLQADPTERPTMTFVVIMLTCTVDLPLPLAPAMSIPQFNMPMTYSGTQQSYRNSNHSGSQQSYLNSTKSDTLRSIPDEDLYPEPR